MGDYGECKYQSHFHKIIDIYILMSIILFGPIEKCVYRCNYNLNKHIDIIVPVGTTSVIQIPFSENRQGVNFKWDNVFTLRINKTNNNIGSYPSLQLVDILMVIRMASLCYLMRHIKKKLQPMFFRRSKYLI